MSLCKFLLPFSLTCLLLRYANGVTVQDLGGSWNVVDASSNYVIEGQVPGGIYSDLMNNNIIDDVFYGYNDVNTRWVSKTNWTYSREIIVEEDFFNNDVINLVFDGIDTFSEISINDAVVGTTDNMFVQYIFNVKSYLQVGENTISIKFLSPVDKAALLYDIQASDYPVPPTCVPDAYQGECHANHVRKMQASFSWDWGPAFPSVGIWKPVYLEAYRESHIRHINFETQDNDDVWLVKVKIYLSNPPTNEAVTGTITLSLTTDIDLIEQIYDINISPDEDNEYIFTASFSIPQSHVRPWWPNGYGNAYLYKLEATYKDNGEDVSTKSVKVGFRTVSLVQEPVIQGLSFYFVVNNVPIFAKGTNSIPVNVLPEKGQDPDTIRFLLQSAKDVHMNMIRVWGGGVYESDLFYEIADEMGILIWQDFMFACSMYPTNEDFLRTVKAEVRHQVRRLQHHPSIILWAGNNENEAALRQNWYGTASNFDLYKKDFITLYVDTVRVETLANDATRSFLVSSPTNGIASEEEGYIAANPADEFFGDVHFYSYIENPWTQTNYPVPRFASEYGLQSLPSLSSLLTATNDTADLAFNSPFMQHRQHHPIGNGEMYALISVQIELPSRDSDIFYKPFIFYSQIIQAMGMKQQTEHYRLYRSDTDNTGRGLTMGALYWQLNDVWVGPTWSGIDFNKNWKMLHYFARNFFSPVIIASQLTGSRTLNIHVVSDLMINSYNNTLTISVYDWQSMTPKSQTTVDGYALSGYSRVVYSVWLDEYLYNSGCGEDTGKYECFIYLTLTDINQEKIAPDNFVFPSSLKTANILNATVELSDIQQLDEEGKEFYVTVTTDAIALFVWLETGDIRGTFSDNGFLQVTGTKGITFIAESYTTVDDLSKAITVTHLRDPQYFD